MTLLVAQAFRNLRDSTRSGGFVRNAGVLTLGTFGAQAVTFLFYPLLTRLFTPAEFGVVAVIYMMTSLLAVIASGAAEGAILIAPSRRSAAHVIGWIVSRSAIVLMAALAITGSAMFFDICQWLDSEVKIWLPAIPILAATVVVYNCFSEWSVREQRFAELARFRIVQNLLVGIVKTGMGYLNLPLNGLIAGDIAGKVLSAFSGVKSILGKNARYFLAINSNRIRQERRRFIRFPRYMMPDQLINTAGGTIHVLFVLAAFGSAELGFVSMTLSVLYLPVTVISSAIKDVFRQRAAVEIQTKGGCRALYLKLLLPVTVVGLFGFGLLYWCSPWLFTLLLGASWAPVGEYAKILIPMYLLNFVSMSMGGVLVVTQRLGVSLGWQLTDLVMTLLALTVGTVVYQTIDATLLALMVVKVVSYVLHMLLSYHYAENGLKSQLLGTSKA